MYQVEKLLQKLNIVLGPPPWRQVTLLWSEEVLRFYNIQAAQVIFTAKQIQYTASSPFIACYVGLSSCSHPEAHRVILILSILIETYLATPSLALNHPQESACSIMRSILATWIPQAYGSYTFDKSVQDDLLNRSLVLILRLNFLYWLLVVRLRAAFPNMYNW